DFPEVVDGDHVRVLQRAGRLRLAQKAFSQRDILTDGVRHDLDRDAAIDQGIDGAIDDAHGAFANDALHLVFPNSREVALRHRSILRVRRGRAARGAPVHVRYDDAGGDGARQARGASVYNDYLRGSRSAAACRLRCQHLCWEALHPGGSYHAIRPIRSYWSSKTLERWGRTRSRPAHSSRLR